MTNVFYGANEEHPLRILQPKLEPLLTSFKSYMSNYDAIKAILSCPSMVGFMRNRFVISAPVDITIYQNQEGVVVAYNESSANKELLGAHMTKTDPDDILSGFSNQTLQMLDNNYLFLIADEPLEIELTPPFLHESPMFGIAGSFDIGKWVRPISFAGVYLKGTEKTYIKRGDPIAYVKFMTDSKVSLHHCYINDKVMSLSNQCVNLKSSLPKQSLEKQYKFADSISVMKTAIREVKSCIY